MRIFLWAFFLQTGDYSSDSTEHALIRYETDIIWRSHPARGPILGAEGQVLLLKLRTIEDYRKRRKESSSPHAHPIWKGHYERILFEKNSSSKLKARSNTASRSQSPTTTMSTAGNGMTPDENTSRAAGMEHATERPKGLTSHGANPHGTTWTPGGDPKGRHREAVTWTVNGQGYEGDARQPITERSYFLWRCLLLRNQALPAASQGPCKMAKYRLKLPRRPGSS